MTPDDHSDDARLTPQGAFVVQFRTGTDLRAGAVRGRVEHVLSGRAAHFASVDDLLRFVDRVLGEAEPSPR
ncbi:MAG: hypothetical protein ACRERC_05925 [Candidatus Binatia bacterium]